MKKQTPDPISINKFFIFYRFFALLCFKVHPLISFQVMNYDSMSPFFTLDKIGKTILRGVSVSTTFST